MDIDEFLDQETKVELSKLTKEEVKADKAIMEKIQAIRDSIHNKRFHDAEKGYLEAREMYQGFAQEQEKVRSLLKEELLSLNKELVENLSVTRTELSRRIKVIQSLIERAQATITQGNAQAAQDLYHQIKALFTNLPDIHSDEKIALENNIVQLYSRILNATARKSQSEFKELYQQMTDRIAQCEQALAQNKFAEAGKKYAEINALYARLPAGFLYEKGLLHKHILELHEILVKSMKQDVGKNNAK